MSDLAVRVESVGKRYRIGHSSDPGGIVAAAGRKVAEPLMRLRGRARPAEAPEDAELWAVRDVSFDVKHGEVLGMIGKNGAGKSTLLKLLSQITLPTEGRITTWGRVSTLIEVGTGFHPELTGRENVFLNGTILGMRRKEIEAKYDEIVDFAGIERFMETPVKRYSSGMHIRLGFAVAAHLDPELLIVDEVLSVGDNDFQRKSLGKMKTVASEGRTVIFVSHNLNAVQRLCSRAMLIEGGGVVNDGTPDAVIGSYLERTGALTTGDVTIVPDGAERNGTGEAKLRQVVMTDLDDRPITAVCLGQPFRVTATFEVFEEIDEAALEIGILTVDGEQILTVQSIDGDRPPVRVPPGMREVTVEMAPQLLPHEFTVAIGLHRMSGITVDFVQQTHRFRALNMNEAGGDHYPWPSVRGFARTPATWSEIREVDREALAPTAAAPNTG